MQIFQNSSPLFMRSNSFLDIKQLKNEIQEEKNLSNFSIKHDNTFCSSQENESPFFQKEEDSNNIFWPEIDNAINTINDLTEESFHSLHIQEKSFIDKNILSINQLNITYDENFSIDNKSLSNDSNDIEAGKLNINLPKLSDEEEKMSGLSGDSFLSNFDICPNQEFINFEINDFISNNYLDEGKNDSSFDIINNSNIKESNLEDIKDKNLKKEKKNFLIQKEPKLNNDINANNNNIINNCNNNIIINLDNNNNNNITANNNKRQRKRKLNKTEFIGKKRDKEIKHKHISLNITSNKIQNINKVTFINPKAYKCECGKIFSTEENQRLHYINIHLHEKPYSCSFCGEGFSHRNGKIYHERVFHTFILPYLCKECESAFASKSAMIYHMKSKHKLN